MKAFSKERAVGSTKAASVLAVCRGFVWTCAVYGFSAEAANLLTNRAGLNQTQTGLGKVAFDACTQRNPLLSDDFRARCDALVGASFSSLQGPLPSVGFDPIKNTLQVISPEQLLAQGATATRVTAGQVALVDSTIGARLATLHGPLRLAGLQMYRNGWPADHAYAGLGDPFANGGAAGDGLSAPLGVWLSGNYHFGDVDSTSNQKGF